MAAHPSNQTLSSFGLGKLDEPLAEAVNQHLERCLDCRKRVAEMSSDSFLDRVRDAGAGAHSGQNASALGWSQTGGTQSHPSAGSAAPPPAETLPPGLADHPDYEVKREIGRGGMGVVYLAHNRLMGRDEVLKVMGRHILERPAVFDRFLREIRAVAKLRHPNIVTAYAATRAGDSIVFAMEYVEGLDLARMVKAKGPLPVAHACNFVQQAALGLQHAHEEGLVHRDIKPGNLMLSRKGDRPVVKVLDFGLAKVAREQTFDGAITREGQALGTPDFIAPEQILNAPEVDVRADIYSLGGTLYYLLTGRPPFRGNSLYDVYQAHISQDADALNLVRPDVPAELAALVAKMMAKDPARRFQTPDEVARALTPFFKPSGASEKGSGPAVSQVGRAESTRIESVQPAALSRSGDERRGPRTEDEKDGRKRETSRGVVVGEMAAPKSDPGALEGEGAESTVVASSGTGGRGLRGRRATGLAAAGAGLVVLLGVIIVIVTNKGTVDVEVQTAKGKAKITVPDANSAPRVEVQQSGRSDPPHVEVPQKIANLRKSDPAPPAVASAPATPANVRARQPDPEPPAPAQPPVEHRKEPALVLNRWIELNPSDGTSAEWQTPVQENTFEDGMVTMARKGHIHFPSIQGRDMTIRAQVQIPRNNRVQMLLRGGDDHNYIGGFYRVADGTSWFGFIKTVRGKWSDVPGGRNGPIAYRDGEFVEFKFTVVGNTLTMHVNGQKMLETRDRSLEGRSGWAGFQVDAPGSRVKEIEVKVLKE